ncbi:MAG TPA: fluoride efflux transporter CrcB [Acidimicrobiales bacterium]|nr:fluoride efflux transporter CrcB [Acidimicrobiales bacterium]
MNPADVVWVGLAGSLGAVARFVTDGTVRTRVASAVPVGTILINIVGSLILGVLTGLVEFHHVTTTLTLVAGTGFCGGFTTFSTASFESVRLLQQGALAAAAVNITVTVAGTLVAAGAGIALASL